MKFSIKYILSKCDQIRSFLLIWSHLLKKSLMENFSFCAVSILHFFYLCFKVFIEMLSILFSYKDIDRYSNLY